MKSSVEKLLLCENIQSSVTSNNFVLSPSMKINMSGAPDVLQSEAPAAIENDVGSGTSIPEGLR
eukprot:766856-Hanusia_phi.AAC.1